jgi:hypothetical protein
MEKKLSNLQKQVHKLTSLDAVSIMLFPQLTLKLLTYHQRPCMLISRNGSLTPIAVKKTMEARSLMLSVLMQLTESLFNMQMNLLIAQIALAILMSKIQ